MWFVIHLPVDRKHKRPFALLFKNIQKFQGRNHSKLCWMINAQGNRLSATKCLSANLKIFPTCQNTQQYNSSTVLSKFWQLYSLSLSRIVNLYRYFTNPLITIKYRVTQHDCIIFTPHFRMPIYKFNNINIKSVNLEQICQTDFNQN